MKLGPRIIVREEGECYLLYNGDNGALVSVASDAYERCILRDDEADPNYRELRDQLLENGFFEGSPSRPKSVGNPQELLPSEAGGFFALRSNRNPLNVLWALTPRCNLRCIYCFPDAPRHMQRFAQPGLTELLRVAEKIIEASVLKVILSGGESLLLGELWRIIERFRDAGLTVAVISNGTTICDEIADRLAGYGVHIGVSLDGPTEECNSRTRGPGAFERTVRGLTMLLSAGVSTGVLVTLTKHNFPALREHVAFLVELGVRCVTLQDLRPFATRAMYDATRLTPQQEQQLPETIGSIMAAHRGLLVNPTELLLFSKQTANGKIMQCPGGDNFAYVDFFGDVFPCTSLTSFRLGNVFGESSLTELWRTSAAIRELRTIKTMPLEAIAACRSCPNKAHCEGGCRGDALFYTGKLFGMPSRCPKALGILS